MPFFPEIIIVLKFGLFWEIKMYKGKSKVSEAFSFKEDIVGLIFDNIPDDSPLVVIVDKKKKIHASDGEKLANLGVENYLLLSICAHIDDGAEPVVVEDGNCTIVGSQLRTENVNCGYVMVLVDGKFDKTSEFVALTLVEMILQQANVIASLLEKNELLQRKRGNENFDLLGISRLVESVN